MNHSRTPALVGGLLLSAGVLHGCSGGGGSSPEQGGFQLVSISVPEGATWPINKPIVLTFNAEVDLSTVVAGSTLQLKSTGGSGASAFYEVGYVTDFATGAVDRTRLIVQPFCPLLFDFSDAGLLPGGIGYQVFVPGQSSGSSSTIKSIGGAKLEQTQKRNFVTPDSLNPAVVFEDTGIGAPIVIPQGTFVRLGDGTEIPFVESGTGFELPATLPLNLYSDPDTQVEFLVQLNQAVDPAADNLGPDLVRIEFLDNQGEWQPFQTLASLETNCALGTPGALLRLEPTGILPQGTMLRLVLSEGFSDLVGQESEVPFTGFLSPTATLDFESLTPPDLGADEVFEPFNVGAPASFEDPTAVFDTPPAVWAGGALTSGFDFVGTGGPGGTFDWHTPPGTITFNTDFQSGIVGGPDGVPAFSVNAVGGVLDVNDLVISQSTNLRVLSTDNPLTILATGNVTIRGTIDVSGFHAKSVGTLLTPNLPEPGGAGTAGGGTGGTGSYLTSSSTPAGGIGFGPGEVPNIGGGGGEAGFANTPVGNNRRGAGGAGARFARDQGPGIGLVAESGEPGTGQGAISAPAPPVGGTPNAGPFVDVSNDNDFWGVKGLYTDGELTGLITGELANPHAGYGGGAGGDNIESASFPTIPFVTFDSAGAPVYKDRKGAGGGGGGGQVRIICLGKVIFEDGGRILCDGGYGGLGESQAGSFYIAGSSGGGSGGHVIIESASQVDFTGGGTIAGAQIFVEAVGGFGPDPEDEEYKGVTFGQGVAGQESFSGGGHGGPGVIQIHVPDPNVATAVGTDETAAIRVPAGTTIAQLTSPPAQVLVPTFGARSKARSIWIPTGGAAFDPDGAEQALQFEFDGTIEDDLDPDAGKVVTSSQVVVPPAPILGPEALGAAAPSPVVAPDGVTLILSEASLQPLITDAGTPPDDIYLRNPALLTNFSLRLTGPSLSKDFTVLAAAYSDAEVALGIVTDSSAGTMSAFIASQGAPADVTYELIPRFFRVRTGSSVDALPDTAFVKVLFQATRELPNGLPDEANPVVDWTADISDFNAAPPGDVDFFRFEVEFDLDATGAGVSTSTVPVSLEFLRIPFAF